MKRKWLLSLAVVGLLFTSCADTKQKEAEEAAIAERAEMEAEALRLAEEEAKLRAEFDNNTIVALAAKNENFTTLVAALKAGGLVEALSSEGPFTVFAPSNEAFAALPKGALDDLLKEENVSTLESVLTYHVIPGEVNAEAVLKAIEENNNAFAVKTIQGEELTLSLKGEDVIVTDAKGGKSKVTIADIEASNGVIHAIDKVIMPKG